MGEQDSTLRYLMASVSVLSSHSSTSQQQSLHMAGSIKARLESRSPGGGSVLTPSPLMCTSGNCLLCLCWVSQQLWVPVLIRDSFPCAASLLASPMLESLLFGSLLVPFPLRPAPSVSLSSSEGLLELWLMHPPDPKSLGFLDQEACVPVCLPNRTLG